MICQPYVFAFQLLMLLMLTAVMEQFFFFYLSFYIANFIHAVLFSLPHPPRTSQQGSRQRGYSTEPPHSSAVLLPLAVISLSRRSMIHVCEGFGLLARCTAACCRHCAPVIMTGLTRSISLKCYAHFFVRQWERKMDSESEMDRQTGEKESGSEGSCWAHAARITDCMLWLSVSVWVCVYLMCPHKRSKMYQVLQAVELGSDRNCQYCVFSF